MEVVMPQSQRRTAVALFVFVMLSVLGVLGTGLAAAESAEPAPVTPETQAQPIVEPNPIPLWLSGISEVCYDGFNGCQPEAPGPCCWRCAGGSGSWGCGTATSASQCKSKCATACGSTCAWI
jgi:hypothetical protein